MGMRCLEMQWNTARSLSFSPQRHGEEPHGHTFDTVWAQSAWAKASESRSLAMFTTCFIHRLGNIGEWRRVAW